MSIRSSSAVSAGTPGGGISVLCGTVPFSKSLCVFSNRARFTLTSSNALSPGGTQLSDVARFASSASMVPINTNGSICFISGETSFTSIGRCQITRCCASAGSTRSIATRIPCCVPGSICGVAKDSGSGLLFIVAATRPGALCICGCLCLGKGEIRDT